MPTEPIDDFIDREMPGSGVPGLAYAVVANGEVETVGAYGVVKPARDRAERGEVGGLFANRPHPSPLRLPINTAK
ncbi:Beta-lactamase [Enhygromyxa salina]|uniref:Beta-lactamase n=1 Tax=Enhygromyxa salina TaxID=215803 RepID=A0A0C2CWQ2_9BACT|nr:hypothetical protein [Enhygromyxa salina]KIG14055.1 Beta-lactamase [Enhygromyxa salina]